MNKGKVLDADKLKESEVECNIISDEVKVEYLRHRVKWLEIDNAALRKELAELKQKLKDLI